MIKRIGVLTSGGDAPGMNAAIRAVVRTAIAEGMEVYGFKYGYEGLISPDFRPLISADVAGIINRGGTFLRTARCLPFLEKNGREQAVANLKEFGVDGLVTIGGDGTLRGANCLHQEFDFPVISVPGSIDNDVPCTDFTIGFDTAVNCAVEAIDRVRDTAYSHDRVFVIEVMGRSKGFIAIEAGLAAGAEAILIPERPFEIDSICKDLHDANLKGKRSNIVVVAEGAASAVEIRDKIFESTGLEARYLVLGHMQRGGAPTASDRVLALRLGAAATKLLAQGKSGLMVGVDGTKVFSSTFEEVGQGSRPVDQERLDLVASMAI